MDQKKVIAKLIKIADNQQKIINKLAQELHPTTPGNLNPSRSEHQLPAQALKEGLVAAGLMRLLVGDPDVSGSTITVKFVQGARTQENFNKILAVIKKLQEEGKLLAAHYELNA